MQPDPLISRTEGWLAARVGDDLLMMSADSTAYLNLSGSGARIWELLDQPRNLAGLCSALAAEYSVQPAQIRAEVQAFLETLQGQHAIHLDPSSMA